MRGFFIVALLFTVYCSLFTKTLFAIRYWLFATVYCSLFTVHQNTIRYSLLAIRYCLLFTVHSLIANFRIRLTGPGQCCE